MTSPTVFGMNDFNPRSHEGSDFNNFCSLQIPKKISILAPTRGATDYGCGIYGICGYFNPRSHEGSDCKLPIEQLNMDDFNPRSHEGSDHRQVNIYVK